MEAKEVVPWALAFISAGLGWWMNDLWQAHKQLRTELAIFMVKVPETYVSKADFKEDLDEIKQTLRDIRSELRSGNHRGDA